MAWYRRFVVCWESFVPGGPIGAVCWESFIPVRSAGFRVGRVLSRSSGETARSEGVLGLRGLAGLRGDAPSEARGVGGERAGRPRTAREVWRGAPHGSLATGGSTEVWRWYAERSSLGWRLRCRWSWSPDRRVVRGLQGLAGLRGDAPSEARGADDERAGRPRAARRSGRPRATRRSGRPRAARRSGDWVPRGRRAGGPPPTGA